MSAEEAIRILDSTKQFIVFKGNINSQYNEVQLVCEGVERVSRFIQEQEQQLDFLKEMQRRVMPLINEEAIGYQVSEAMRERGMIR